jgi:hypothetical protein
MKSKYLNFKQQIENVKECCLISDLSKSGHYIGDIDNFISEKFYKNNLESEDKILSSIKLNINIDNQNIYNVIDYTNEVPLILDSMKSYFFIAKTHYIVANIEGKKYLVYRNQNEVSLNHYLNNNIKNVEYIVQRIFTFSWLMCIKKGFCLSYEDKIMVKNLNPFLTKVSECKSLLQGFTINEKKYMIDINEDVSTTILSKWFKGEIEIFYNVAKEMLEGVDIEAFRSSFKDVILFYNDDYVCWINSVYNRMKFIKNL